jgi:hypothetical protein
VFSAKAMIDGLRSIVLSRTGKPLVLSKRFGANSGTEGTDRPGAAPEGAGGGGAPAVRAVDFADDDVTYSYVPARVCASILSLTV